MKKKIILSAALLFAVTCMFAQQAPKGGKKGKKSPESIMKKSDTNGDGKISKEEAQAENQVKFEAKFKKMDTNGDNSISMEELQAHQDRKHNHERATPEERIKKLDLNGDGKLDMKEVEKSDKEYLKKNFKAVDKDQDGFLTAEEVGSFSKKKGDRPQKSPTEIIDKHDTNKDGKISKEEAENSKHMTDKFEKLDKNKDGFITTDELEKMQEEREMRREKKGR